MIAGGIGGGVGLLVLVAVLLLVVKHKRDEGKSARQQQHLTNVRDSRRYVHSKQSIQLTSNPLGHGERPASTLQPRPASRVQSVDELPAGWEQHLDEGSGEMYYHEIATGITQWFRPQ